MPPGRVLVSKEEEAVQRSLRLDIVLAQRGSERTSAHA